MEIDKLWRKQRKRHCLVTKSSPFSPVLPRFDRNRSSFYANLHMSMFSQKENCKNQQMRLSTGACWWTLTSQRCGAHKGTVTCYVLELLALLVRRGPLSSVLTTTRPSSTNVVITSRPWMGLLINSEHERHSTDIHRQEPLHTHTMYIVDSEK